MTFTRSILSMLILAVMLVACDQQPEQETRSFRITLTNTVNLLSSQVFNTPDGATDPGPIAAEGGFYTIQFQAVPGSRLSFANMLANSNDWFFAPGENGIELFDANDNPVTGDITSSISMYDSGTEEEDPSTIATQPDGGTSGDPDDDTSVRLQQADVSNYLSATLAYDNGSFTLTLTKGVDGVITPGLVLIHAQDNPLFELGTVDRGQGLKEIAEAGNPAVLSDWINETGTDGAPLRLSAALTPFAPAVVYAFEGDADPLFTQNEEANAGSGLKEMSEDGNNQIIFDYLQGLDLPVAQQNESGPIGPGESYTFDIDVPVGYKLGIASMLIQSNDWFVAFNNNGADLFDASGSPIEGTQESVQLYLWDAGTEADEPVGFGANQAPRQSGAGAGDPDPNTLVRRVSEITNTQFGNTTVTSGPGVVSQLDPRGGYNVVLLNVEAL